MLDEARWGRDSFRRSYVIGPGHTHSTLPARSFKSAWRTYIDTGRSLHIPPLESLVLDFGRFLMGKRVDILVVDGLDGLEELGVFGVVFCIGGLLGFNGIRSRGDALQVHGEDQPVVGPAGERERAGIEAGRGNEKKTMGRGRKEQRSETTARRKKRFRARYYSGADKASDEAANRPSARPHSL